MLSLEMVVEIIDGFYVIDAPWLSDVVKARSFEEAYELALEGRRERAK